MKKQQAVHFTVHLYRRRHIPLFRVAVLFGEALKDRVLGDHHLFRKVVVELEAFTFDQFYIERGRCFCQEHLLVAEKFIVVADLAMERIDHFKQEKVQALAHGIFERDDVAGVIEQRERKGRGGVVFVFF